MRVELHTHSTCSDGDLAPGAIAAKAAASEIEIFALTDHDTISGYAEAMAHAGSMIVLRGVELSCRYQGRSIHVLVYGRAHDCWDAIQLELVEISQQRRLRILEMAERLARKGHVIDANAILDTAHGRSVGRPDIARALVAAGVVADMKSAFSRFLYDGSPVVVPSSTLSMADAMKLVEECGARASLAHPHVYGEKLVAEIFAEFPGMTGIEAYYGAYKGAAARPWLDIARRHRLVATGGSDLHERDGQLGIELSEVDAAALVAWLGLDMADTVRH